VILLQLQDHTTLGSGVNVGEVLDKPRLGVEQRLVSLVPDSSRVLDSHWQRLARHTALGIAQLAVVLARVGRERREKVEARLISVLALHSHQLHLVQR